MDDPALHNLGKLVRLHFRRLDTPIQHSPMCKGLVGPPTEPNTKKTQEKIKWVHWPCNIHGLFKCEWMQSREQEGDCW